jgi:hypothetical protein
MQTGLSAFLLRVFVTFNRNVVSVAVNMFSHLTQFSLLRHFIHSVLSDCKICKDNVTIKSTAVQHRKVYSLQR